MASKKKLSEDVNLFENKEKANEILSVNLPINLEESKRLLQEIQIKEIELELENDQLKLANNELQSSIDNLFKSFRNSSIACITILENGRIENLNTSASELLGLTPQSYSQSNFFDLLPENFKNDFVSLLNSVKNRNSAINAEIDILNVNGLLVRTRADVTYLEHNKSFNILLIPLKSLNFAETTKFQGATKNKERSEKLIFKTYDESAPDIIFRLDTNFRIIFFNSVIEEITGISPRFLIGKKSEDLGLPKDVTLNWQTVLQKVISTGAIQETNFEFQGKDRKICFNLRIGPETTPNGKVNTLLGIARDVTHQKKWEIALKQSESNYKYTESIAHVGSYQHDLKADICTWSDEFYRICGFEPQSFTPSQQKFLSIIHPEDRHTVAYAIQNAIYYKNGYKLECRILLPDGKIRYLLTVGRIITNEQNDPIEIKGAIQDVTELKKIELSLKESEENYRMLFESLPVGLAISDITGRIIYGNKKSRILLGISRTEIRQGGIDVSRWKFIRKDGTPISFDDLPSFKAYTQNRIMENLEVGIIKENQKLTWLNVTAAPMQKPSEILIAFIDISEKIEREKQLNELTGKLQELNATKDKFFSIIAHDLKNPFNSILGFSDLLLKNVSKYTYDEIERFMSIIHATSQNAYNLLENLLNWSRSQTGTIEFCPHLYEITEIIFSNIEFVENLALKKNISINFSPEEKFLVEIDKNMMDTVLRNLLTNAIKFSYPGGKIDIGVHELKNSYEISIKDYGIGIESENLNKLFKIDSKYSSFGTSQEKGSGLGLIICKEFVEKNNGKISAKSEFKKGSVFTVTLPKAGLIYNDYSAD